MGTEHEEGDRSPAQGNTWRWPRPRWKDACRIDIVNGTTQMSSAVALQKTTLTTLLKSRAKKRKNCSAVERLRFSESSPIFEVCVVLFEGGEEERRCSDLSSRQAGVEPGCLLQVGTYLQETASPLCYETL
jgi:hypothetical protein